MIFFLVTQVKNMLRSEAEISVDVRRASEEVIPNKRTWVHMENNSSSDKKCLCIFIWITVKEIISN